MRLIVDTNVVISALLKADSVPDRALRTIWNTGALVVYDQRIADEYREVAARPKFKSVAATRREALLSQLLKSGERLVEVGAWDGPMIDESDRIFVEAALQASADAIVTGNGKHFPTDLGFDVHPPAALLALLGG